MAEKSPEVVILQGNGKFSLNLHKILSKNEGNVFFSPISVHAILSMVYQGADGSTADQFAATLHVHDVKTAAEGYNQVMKDLNSIENVTLLMANKIYPMDGFGLNADFENRVTKNFFSEVQLVNFGQNEKAAKIINDWIGEQTKGKITDLINKDDLGGDTRLVLVNAVYFKGDWKHKFDETQTRTKPFYLNDENNVDVQMMHMNGEFPYCSIESLDAAVLELPYTNEGLSMIIILPNKRNGIGELEEKLATLSLEHITKRLNYREVNIALPRFKMETFIDLKDPLKKLDLQDMFVPGIANFKNIMKTGENIHVSRIVQKAFIEVNEAGSEAAAATGMIMISECSNPYIPPPVNFTVDHCCVFLLVKSKYMSNVGYITTPLFMGSLREF